ncbi:MAG: hypothetical protein Q9179_007302, partial [Wetmoreana sp. 5 TL-2023]
MSLPEILVHVAAPSHRSDDARYRKEASGILHFEPVKRHVVLPRPQSACLEQCKARQASRDVTSQDTQQSLVHDSVTSNDPVPRHHLTNAFTTWTTSVLAQDSIASNDPAPRQHLTAAFKKWTTPILPRPSPNVLVGRTPAPFHTNRNLNRSSNLLVERTPADQYRPRTAPLGPSVIQETPNLRRSFSDSFETPPSVIPDSQPSESSQNHDNNALELGSSPSPTHQEEPSAKRRKRHNGIEGLGNGAPPDDTSTPPLNA